MSRWIDKWSDGTKVDRDKIKAIQGGMGIKPDGYMGDHTLDALYREFGKPDKCYMEKFYGAYVITGKIENIKLGLCKYLPENSVSGTFQWQGKPTSVLIDDKVYRDQSSHDWKGKPDTVLYCDKGQVYSKRCIVFNEICDWAIGGVGLHNWNPIQEGYGDRIENGVYKGDYSDVHRRTYHTAVGVYEDGYAILVYARATGEGMRMLMMDLLKCKYSVMLDGGHIAAINSKVNKNTAQVQNNFIGFKF